MRRCLFGKTVSKFLVAALTLTMIMTVIEPVGSYAAEEEEEKKAEAEVVVEAKEAPAEEGKAEEPEKKEEAKEEKEPEKKETKKKAASTKKLNSIDDLTFTLTAKVATSDLYKRKDGVLKAEFEVAWSDSDAYNALIDSGWTLTYTLKDVASGKDLGYAEGKKYTVTSSQNEGYSLVVKAETAGETTKTFKDTTTSFKFPSKTKKVTAKCPSTSRTVTLKWTKVSGAAGYYIYRNTKKVKPSKPYKKISKGSKVKFEDKKMAEFELELANINYEIKKLDFEIADYEKRNAIAEFELIDSGLTEEDFKELTNNLLDKNLSDEEYEEIMDRLNSLPRDDEDKITIEDDEDFVAYMIIVMGFYGLMIRDLRKQKLKLLETEIQIREDMLESLKGES